MLESYSKPAIVSRFNEVTKDGIGFEYIADENSTFRAWVEDDSMEGMWQHGEFN